MDHLFKGEIPVRAVDVSEQALVAGVQLVGGPTLRAPGRRAALSARGG